MATEPRKFLFIYLNENLELKLSIPAFTIMIISMAIITLFANIFALFSVPLYLGIIFAAVSEKIQYKFEELYDFEEE